MILGYFLISSSYPVAKVHALLFFLLCVYINQNCLPSISVLERGGRERAAAGTFVLSSLSALPQGSTLEDGLLGEPV